jgi:hypothetical protein
MVYRVNKYLEETTVANAADDNVEVVPRGCDALLTPIASRKPWQSRSPGVGTRSNEFEDPGVSPALWRKRRRHG